MHASKDYCSFAKNFLHLNRGPGVMCPRLGWKETLTRTVSLPSNSAAVGSDPIDLSSASVHARKGGVSQALGSRFQAPGRSLFSIPRAYLRLCCDLRFESWSKQCSPTYYCLQVDFRVHFLVWYPMPWDQITAWFPQTRFKYGNPKGDLDHHYTINFMFFMLKFMLFYWWISLINFRWIYSR
jgi:hypothetical protein